MSAHTNNYKRKTIETIYKTFLLTQLKMQYTQNKIHMTACSICIIKYQKLMSSKRLLIQRNNCAIIVPYTCQLKRKTENNFFIRVIDLTVICLVDFTCIELFKLRHSYKTKRRFLDISSLLPGPDFSKTIIPLLMG